MIVTNPFENKDGLYYVLKNDEGQYSLWPHFIDMPNGWEIVFGQADLLACQDYIETNWKDLIPNSVKKEVIEAPM